MKNPLKTFRQAKVFPKNQEFLGNMFLKTIKECNCREAANDILLAAYMLKLNNYFQIEDEFNKKFPIQYIKES